MKIPPFQPEEPSVVVFLQQHLSIRCWLSPLPTLCLELMEQLRWESSKALDPERDSSQASTTLPLRPQGVAHFPVTRKGMRLGKRRKEG